MTHASDDSSSVASPLTWGIDETVVAQDDKPRLPPGYCLVSDGQQWYAESKDGFYQSGHRDGRDEAILDAWELALGERESECARKALLVDELWTAIGGTRENSFDEVEAMAAEHRKLYAQIGVKQSEVAESIESIFARRGFVLFAEVVALDPSHRADELFIGVREQIDGREVVRPLALRSITSQRLGVVFLYYESIVGPNESSSVRLDQVEAAWSAWMLARAGGR